MRATKARIGYHKKEVVAIIKLTAEIAEEDECVSSDCLVLFLSGLRPSARLATSRARTFQQAITIFSARNSDHPSSINVAIQMGTGCFGLEGLFLYAP